MARYLCIDNQDFEEMLTTNKIYIDNPHPEIKTIMGIPYIQLTKADDGLPFLCQPYRVEEIKEEIGENLDD